MTQPSHGRTLHAPAPIPVPVREALESQVLIGRGNDAEMRWDAVDTRRNLTPQSQLYVHHHTSVPLVDPTTYRLRVYGDGLSRSRTAAGAYSLSMSDLRSLPHTRLVCTLESAGNGRFFFGAQQGTPTPGVEWGLGAVGAVEWEGVTLASVLERLGLSPDAVSVQASGLDPHYVVDGVDYGRVRRPLPMAKALEDTLLAWSANGEPLTPEHGFPLRLVVPGWVGIASIKWLGSLEVSTRELSSPWSTTWYRPSGGDHPDDAPPLTVNPVRSAWLLPRDAVLSTGGRAFNGRWNGSVVRLNGRSWSGAGPIRRVEVSTDGGVMWRRAKLWPTHEGAWTQWTFEWRNPTAGRHDLMARATDSSGRQQPMIAAYDDHGYFFDAVVRHPVTVI